jgi:hypothetical protein
MPVLSQQSSTLFNQLTEQYANKEGFSASMLTHDMFDLYVKKRNLEETSPVFEALKNLDLIVVVSQSKLSFNNGMPVTDKTDQPYKDQLHETILDYYKKNNYLLFKTEKRMGEDVKVYLKKDQDKIASLALITNSSTATNLVDLQGDIDLKTVSELSKALNVRGLENLYKLDNNALYFGPYSRDIYPKERIDEMVARQREEIERQRHLTEEQRSLLELRAKELAEKAREMEEKYRRQPIFLSTPGDTNIVYFINGKKVKASEIKTLDTESIESIEVKKAEKKEDKSTIRIKTK